MIVDDLCRLVRAKNAGPYRLTVDCFCNDRTDYQRLVEQLDTATVADALGVAVDDVQRFELDDLQVLKFGMPRPVVQGSLGDRDLHGAQWAHVIAALPLAAAPVQRKVGTFAIVVRDYDEAIEWYTRCLGFVIKEDTAIEDKRWVVLSSTAQGPDVLLAQATDDAQAARVGDQTGGRVGFFLQTEDFARDHAAFTAAGVQFVEEPRHEVYGSVAVFEDIYGNRWDLIEKRE